MKCGFCNEHLKGQKKETNFLWFVRKGAKREALLAPGGDGQGLAGSNTHTHTHAMPGCCKITSITVFICYGMQHAPPKSFLARR